MLCFIFQITKGMKQFNKKSLDIKKIMKSTISYSHFIISIYLEN